MMAMKRQKFLLNAQHSLDYFTTVFYWWIDKIVMNWIILSQAYSIQVDPRSAKLRIIKLLHLCHFWLQIYYEFRYIWRYRSSSNDSFAFNWINIWWKQIVQSIAAIQVEYFPEHINSFSILCINVQQFKLNSCTKIDATQYSIEVPCIPW